MDKESEYGGWLTSTSLIKRSIAVFGHCMLGYLLVALSVMAIFMVVGLLVSIINAL